jgi:hypothetical protein
LINYNTNAYIF